MSLFKKKNSKPQSYFLSVKDIHTFETFITQRIGPFESVLHEIVSPDLHIDIIIVPPSESRNYITLITEGMSAYPMPVPPNFGTMNRAELAMRLPKDWNIHSREEQWYWPIRVLKTLALMPYLEKSWLGFYHDIDFGHPFSTDTALSAILLDIFDETIEPLKLESGDTVVIYNALPLYPSEMAFRDQAGATALLNKMSDDIIHGPLDVHRDKII